MGLSDTHTGEHESVTVVIPTFNRGAYLLDTVRDLQQQTYRPLEVLVVDQSDDVDPALVETVQQSGGLMSHHRVGFQGLPQARNFGWQMAASTNIVFVDDDIRCGPELVSEHARGLQQKGVGVVAGGIREVKGAGGERDRPGRFNRWTASPSRGFASRRDVDVDHVPGGNFSCLRQVIREAGGFDEALSVGASLYEETDFSLRVLRLGYRIRFNGRARLTHLSAASGGCRVSDISSYMWALGHNRAVLVRRHVAAIYWPTALARLVLLGLSYSAEYQQTRPLRACLSGFAKGWHQGRMPPVCTDYLAMESRS